MDINVLRQQFGSDQVKFSKGSGNFVFIEITNAKAKAKICTYGAHIMEFTPCKQRPLLWMSGNSWYELGKPIRGGVPICWPWFGAGASEMLPAHGFARISQWHVIDIKSLEYGATQVELALCREDVSNPALTGFPFELRMEFIIGSELQMRLSMKNLGDQPQTISAALHTYFSVSAVEQVLIRGLDQVGFEDRVVGASKPYGNTQVGDIKIDREVDRLYLDTRSAVEIIDPGFDRLIRIEKEGSASTVIWNPWIRKSQAMPDFGDEEYHGMLCVEAVNAGSDTRIIAPGIEHALVQRISIQ